jgi:hypothetical protein
VLKRKGKLVWYEKYLVPETLSAKTNNPATYASVAGGKELALCQVWALMGS